MYHWRIESDDTGNCQAISDMGLRVPLGISYKHFNKQILDAQEQLKIEQEAFQQEAEQSFDRTTLSGREVEINSSQAPAALDESTGMYKDYWVLPESERAKGFIRPIRKTYIHQTCKTVTTMNSAIAETYARNPSYYGATFCSNCGGHFPVGEDGEFLWEDGSRVGT